MPVASMPEPLRTFAQINPFTKAVNALRSLWLGVPAGDNIWLAFVWIAVIIGVFAPLAVAWYRRAAST